MKGRFLLWITLLTGLFLAGCNSNIPKAEAVAQEFYSAVMHRNYFIMEKVIDDSVKKNVPLSQWEKVIDSLQVKRGAINKINPVKVEMFKDLNKNLIIVLTYKVFYEKGLHYERLFLIFRDKSDHPGVMKYEYDVKG